MTQDTKAVWSESVSSEIAYWERTISKDPAAFLGRYSRSTPVNELLPPLVGLLPGPRADLLDVGCGPAPVVLGEYPKPVRIVACDPLADDYRRLLAPYGIDPPVEFVRAEGERLVEVFGAGRFDVTHIQNALDHAYAPVDVVRNMVRVTRPGGLVVIKTLIDEGAAEHYHGLHQWDISPGAGDFHIRHRDGTSTAMRAALGDEVEAVLVGTHTTLPGKEAQEWLNVVLIRPGLAPDVRREIEREFFATMFASTGKLLTRVRASDASVERLRRQLAAAEARVAELERSTSYQLGRAIVRTAKSPARLPALPREVLRLARRPRG